MAATISRTPCPGMRTTWKRSGASRSGWMTTPSPSTRPAHVVFDGTAFVFNERPVLWAAGGEFTHERQLWRSLWRDGEGDIVDPADVVGWFTIESDGERDRLSQFAEVAVPLMDDWDVVLSARHDDHDDVGRAVTRRVASGWRLNDNLAVRGAWSSAEKAPFLAGLHAGTVTLAERIFDPQAGFRYGVETHNVGNPKLRPDRAENIGLGVVGTRGGMTLSADWYRTRLSRMLAYVSTQAAIDHAHAHRFRRPATSSSIATPALGVHYPGQQDPAHRRQGGDFGVRRPLAVGPANGMGRFRRRRALVAHGPATSFTRSASSSRSTMRRDRVPRHDPRHPGRCDGPVGSLWPVELPHGRWPLRKLDRPRPFPEMAGRLWL